MYYILNHQLTHHEKADMKIDGVVFDNEGNIIANIFNQGKPLKNEKFQIIIQEKYSKSGKIRDKIWVRINRETHIFVASPNVIRLFEELNIRDVEFLDVKIKGDGIDINDFKIINILKRIDCADDLKSELIYYDDTRDIYAIEELALDNGKIPGNLDIFQMDRTEDNVTIVSQRFVDLINEKGLTGFQFTLPQKFTMN